MEDGACGPTSETAVSDVKGEHRPGDNDNEPAMFLELFYGKCVDKIFGNTVKLGYNELGYSELPLITNKKNNLVGSR